MMRGGCATAAQGERIQRGAGNPNTAFERASGYHPLPARADIARTHPCLGHAQRTHCGLTICPTCVNDPDHPGFGGNLLSNSVAAPIFTVSTAGSIKSYGLFGVLAAAARGELLDLPGMAAHQRAPLVTVLAMLMHVLSRYAEVDRASERLGKRLGRAYWSRCPARVGALQ